MKFNITDRTLMKMLFEREAISEISGICKTGRYERKWTVVFHPLGPFCDESYFTGTVSGIYSETAEGITLDEVLDGLEAIIKEAAA